MGKARKIPRLRTRQQQKNPKNNGARIPTLTKETDKGKKIDEPKTEKEKKEQENSGNDKKAGEKASKDAQDKERGISTRPT